MNKTLKNILALDTSGSHLVLALSYGTDRLIKSDNKVGKSQGQVILKKIEELFGSSGLERHELQAIVVCRGPGSFTGLRIGLAVAKGLAVALDVPVAGATLFQLAAFKWKEITETRHLVIPSRKDEYYLGTIDGGEVTQEKVVRLEPEKILSVISDSEVFALGFDPPLPSDGHKSRFVGRFEYDGADLIALGRTLLADQSGDDVANLEPVYYQKAIAEIRFDQRHGHQ